MQLDNIFPPDFEGRNPESMTSAKERWLIGNLKVNFRLSTCFLLRGYIFRRGEKMLCDYHCFWPWYWSNMTLWWQLKHLWRQDKPTVDPGAMKAHATERKKRSLSYGSYLWSYCYKSISCWEENFIALNGIWNYFAAQLKKTWEVYFPNRPEILPWASIMVRF